MVFCRSLMFLLNEQKCHSLKLKGFLFSIFGGTKSWFGMFGRCSGFVVEKDKIKRRFVVSIYFRHDN